MTGFVAPTASFPYPTLPISGAKIRALTQSLVDEGVTYGLGAKIEPLSLQSDQLPAFSSVDCSGFVRWAIFHALGQPPDFDFADGSAQQHEQVAAAGFKSSTYEDAYDLDEWVRIAFLTPEDGGGVGHVVLIFGGATYESYGGHGPDRACGAGAVYG